VIHLVHCLPEPAPLHPLPGVYVPPTDALEQQEVRLRQGVRVRC
jgi:hypothetical protein